jgi:inorganic triphosphatase YgiF
MGDEYELKLELTPDQVRSLPSNPLVRSLTQGRSSAQKLHSTYFDTPTRSLDAHEMALRVRRMGRRRMQTLKVRANGPSGLQHFKEFESDITGEYPQLSNITEKDLRALIDKESLDENVAPVFTTEFTRRRWRLSLEETTIELALDLGEIRSGDRTLPICEAELELISGRPSRIFELALSLQESMPFRLESRTKARRGYDLAANFVPQPVYGERPALAPDISLRNAILSVSRACRDHFRANEPAVLGSIDPEGIHQMRVGIRRLRALLQAVRHFLPPTRFEPLAQELGWLQRELGPPRDWDVFIADCLEPLTALQPEDAGLAQMLADAGVLRIAAYEGARTALRSPRYARLVLQLNLCLAQDDVMGKRPLLALPGMAKPWLDTATSVPAKEVSGKRRRKRSRGGDVQQQQYGEASLFLEASPDEDAAPRQAGKAAPLKELSADSMRPWRNAADPCLDEPARIFADHLFAKRGRKLKKRGHGHEHLDEAQLHKLRIEAKKMRYALEFFGNLFEGKMISKAIKALSSLQDSLGGLNDAAVGRRLLKELVRTHPDYDAPPQIAHAFGLVTGWQANRLAEGRSRFGQCWKHYEDVALT